MSEQVTPDEALHAALASVGAAIEALPHDERHERVNDFLKRQGVLGDDEALAATAYARNFLVGVFVNAHWRRWTDHELIMSAKAEALREAADNIDLSEFYDPNPLGRVSSECANAESAAETWLRRRMEESK